MLISKLMSTPTSILLEYKLEARNKSWAWLAKSLDIDLSMISHIRSGRRSMSAELMTRASELLEIPLADLEYAKSVHEEACSLTLDTVRRRACALALMRIWKACSDQELGQIHRLAELIHLKHVAPR